MVFIFVKNLYMFLNMSGIDFNNILASIIIALILFFVIGIVGNYLIKLDHDEDQVTAYNIEIPEGSDEAKAKTSVDSKIAEIIAPMLASASLEKGEKILKNVLHATIMKKEVNQKLVLTYGT